MSDLGFGNTAPKRHLDLTGFDGLRKDSTPGKADERAIIDRAAERNGFTSREPTERVMRERKAREPNDQIFVRAPISQLNRFKTYCNETGQSYGDTLIALMDKAGI